MGAPLPLLVWEIVMFIGLMVRWQRKIIPRVKSMVSMLLYFFFFSPKSKKFTIRFWAIGTLFLIVFPVQSDQGLVMENKFSVYKKISKYKDCGVVTVNYQKFDSEKSFFYAFDTIYDEGDLSFSWKEVNRPISKCFDFIDGNYVRGRSDGGVFTSIGGGVRHGEDIISALLDVSGISQGVSGYVPLALYYTPNLKYVFLGSDKSIDLNGRSMEVDMISVDSRAGHRHLFFERGRGILRRVVIKRSLPSGTYSVRQIDYLEVDYSVKGK